jgi:hypothetical protein
MANIAMDMEINQYIDASWLPGGELSPDQFKQLKESVKAELKKAKENNATQEELITISKKLPARGIMIDDYAELNLDRKAGARYYYEKLKEAKDEKEAAERQDKIIEAARARASEELSGSSGGKPGRGTRSNALGTGNNLANKVAMVKLTGEDGDDLDEADAESSDEDPNKRSASAATPRT